MTKREKHSGGGGSRVISIICLGIYIGEYIFAGDLFPGIADHVLQFLRPIKHIGSFIHRFDDPENQKYDLVQSHPSIVLDVLSKIVGDDPETHPYRLSELLDELVKIDQTLRDSPHWKRLKKIA